MGIIQQLGQRLGIRASKTGPTGVANPSAWLVDLLGGPDSSTGIKVTEENALTANAVWSCVRILSETIAALPLHVYRNLDGGGKERATGYPLYELLHDQPNPEMTTMEWRETSMGHLALWGNSFSEIELDQAFRPVAIWPLRPDRMLVWRDSETLQLEYVYQLYQGGTVYFRPEQILHIRTLSRDGILGLSPIAQQREVVGGDLAQERYGGSLFGNGANPGGIINVPGVLSKDKKEELRDSWERQHRGPGNAGRTAVLEQGVTWQQVGMPPEDTQFILNRHFSVEQIARIYRMPLHKLQDLTHATFANIEQQGLEFVTDCLLPYLVRWEQAARRSLIPERERSSYFVRHDVNALLRGDLPSRYAAYATGRQWGWLSADDIRDKEDMNPLPDGVGQQYLQPLNMVPAGTEPPEPAAPTPPPSPDGPGAGGMGGDPATGGVGGVRLLESFLTDIGRRLVAREDADICRAARRYLGRRQPREFAGWLATFTQDHRAFVVQQVLPVLKVLDDEFAGELADELAERHLRALAEHLAGYEDLADLERRLARWKAERPALLAQREGRRALRAVHVEDASQGALAELGRAVARLAEPREAPSVTIDNHQPPVNVEVAPPPPANVDVRVDAPPPAELRIEPGAVQVEVAPPPPAEVTVNVAPPPPAEVAVTAGAVNVAAPPPAEITVNVEPPPPAQIHFGEGAIRSEVAAPPPANVDVQVAAPPPADIRVDVAPSPPAQVNFEPGAVQVDVQAPAPAEVRVDVAPSPPAQVNFDEGAIRVDVAPPPPADVRIEPGAVQVDVQAPPPAEVTIAEGAVQVDVAPPPPADVRIEPGAVQVDVAPGAAPQVTFEEGSVQLAQPPPPPKPRLEAAKAKVVTDKTAELKKRRTRRKRPEEGEDQKS